MGKFISRHRPDVYRQGGLLLLVLLFCWQALIDASINQSLAKTHNKPTFL